jgi:hypothetical protein
MTKHVTAGNQAFGCSRTASCRLRVGMGLGTARKGGALGTSLNNNEIECNIVARMVKHSVVMGWEEHVGGHLNLQRDAQRRVTCTTSHALRRTLKGVAAFQ